MHHLEHHILPVGELDVAVVSSKFAAKGTGLAPVAEGAEKVGAVAHTALGVYHVVGFFTSDDPDEMREHAGGAGLAALAVSQPETAPFIAAGEFIFGDAFDRAAGYVMNWAHSAIGTASERLSGGTKEELI